jgi:DNA-binding NtrC family response regulator
VILVVDDDPDIQEVLKDRLESLGYSVLAASNGREALEVLDKENPQLLLLDIEMPVMNGLDVLREIRRREIDIPIVMVTAYGTIERAVQAMKEGAYDFIPKPFEPDHISIIVRKALERERFQREVELLSDEMDSRHRLIMGKSAKMNQAMTSAQKAAQSRSTVLLLGESGTGKELCARAIHNWSDRREQPFVPINCVGLSKELLESELFGHEKGAFTGANQLKKGKIELAHGGTVFLDEVGDISQELQTKLLSFLQEREFDRVGGTKPIRVDVRIIAATNRDLERAVKEGGFRADLYYRLNVIPITLPPLRERREDIPALADYFLERFSKETKKRFGGISPDVRERLMAYDWPGNVRELANVIERAVVLGPGPGVTPQDFSPAGIVAEERKEEQSLSYRQAMELHKRAVILQALKETRGNRSAAAKVLGLERAYLLRLMKSLQIS